LKGMFEALMDENDIAVFGVSNRSPNRNSRKYPARESFYWRRKTREMKTTKLLAWNIVVRAIFLVELVTY